MADKVKKPPREKTIFNHITGTKGALMDDVFINNPGVEYGPKELRTATGCKLSHCISHIRQLVSRGFLTRTKTGKFLYNVPEAPPVEVAPPEVMQKEEEPEENNEPENVVAEGVEASEEERMKLGFSPIPTHIYSIEKQPGEDTEEEEVKDEEE